jgi:hypothetical protein
VTAPVACCVPTASAVWAEAGDPGICGTHGAPLLMVL